MIFCNSCDSPVGSEEAAMLRRHGKCTRCYVRSLPPLPALQIGIPPSTDQHGIAALVRRVAAPPPRDVGCTGVRLVASH